MRAFVICMVVAFVSFGAMSMQLGLFQPPAPQADESASEAATNEPTENAAPRVSFPEGLSPTAQANPVPQAAEFQPGPEPHKLVFLKPNGELHPWQERIKVEWQAEKVAETELAVIVGAQKKFFVDRIDYPNGAPSISRYSYDLEVSVVEARTGQVLANRMFRNTPRPVMQREAWETTAIGRAVSHQQVFNWVASLCRAGFPEYDDPNPILTQVD